MVKSAIISLSDWQDTKPAYKQCNIKENHNMKSKLDQKLYDENVWHLQNKSYHQTPNISCTKWNCWSPRCSWSSAYQRYSNYIFILDLTLYVQNFSEETKHVFTFYVIPLHWHAKDNWNPSSYKTRTYLFYIVNTIVADVLVTQGARASATMILT